MPSPQAATVALTHASFADVIRTHHFAIVEFSATWCPPCRVFEPVFAAAAASHPELCFATVNTDDEPMLAAELDIRAQPSVVVFRDGKLVYKHTGALSAKRFEDLLARVTAA